MHEYNELTKKLLAEGYTAEKFPRDKVHIAHGCYSRNGNPLDNVYGGFEYNRIYCESFVYKTGCGMYVKGSNVISSMGFMGEEWCHENDNPVVRCPYDKAQCPNNDPRLHGMRGGGTCIQCWCVCHRTDEPYDYEHSFEKADNERKEEKNRKYQEYSDAHNGRICERHMYYDERTRTWALHYEPKSCAKLCYSQNGYCPILGKQLSKKRGNVYYDIKTSVILDMKDKQISLFDKSEEVTISKGNRFFEKPCSIDICEAFVKANGVGEISYYYEINHSFERFINPTWKFEILNVRAEQKESRDLIQDLRDIKEGIQIYHASDSEKALKEQKKKNRQKAIEKKVAALEKRVLEIGYGNMELFEQNKVCKYLDFDRIDELEAIREQKQEEQESKPKQMSLEDFMNLGGT